MWPLHQRQNCVCMYLFYDDHLLLQLYTLITTLGQRYKSALKVQRSEVELHSSHPSCTRSSGSRVPIAWHLVRISLAQSCSTFWFLFNAMFTAIAAPFYCKSGTLIIIYCDFIIFSDKAILELQVVSTVCVHEEQSISNPENNSAIRY